MLRDADQVHPDQAAELLAADGADSVGQNADQLRFDPVPEELESFSLAPRHLSLLSYLLFVGPMTVNELAARLQIAPTTVSLLVGDRIRQGILERRKDEADRRGRIIGIAADQQPAIASWLAPGAAA